MLLSAERHLLSQQCSLPVSSTPTSSAKIASTIPPFHALIISIAHLLVLPLTKASLASKSLALITTLSSSVCSLCGFASIRANNLKGLHDTTIFETSPKDRHRLIQSQNRQLLRRKQQPKQPCPSQAPTSLGSQPPKSTSTRNPSTQQLGNQLRKLISMKVK